jgi:hypothetical protein
MNKMMITFNGNAYDTSYGSPFDRGSADSYYGRAEMPHFYPNGTNHEPRVALKDMTPEEIDAYYAGYAHNEQFGDKKDWGRGDF